MASVGAIIWLIFYSKFGLKLKEVLKDYRDTGFDL